MNKTKMFALGGKNKKGSILAYSLIVIVTLVSIAAMIAITTTIERKNASATQFSVQALQTADSGLQVGVKGVSEANGSDIIGSIFTTCADGGSDPDYVEGIISIPSAPVGNSAYRFSFYDSSDTDLDCNNARIDEVAKIKSIGTYRDTVRAVEVEVNKNLIPAAADLVFVIDRSNSLSAADFATIKSSVKDLINGLDSNYQVGIVFYNNEVNPTDMQTLDGDKAIVNSFIDNYSESPAEDTDTGLGIQKAIEILAGTNNRAGTNPQSIILITDGVPYEDPASGDVYADGLGGRPLIVCYGFNIYWDITKSSEANNAADTADSSNITIISVGIGLEDLATSDCETAAENLMRLNISSEPEYYLPIDDFDELDDVLDSLG